MRFPIDFCVPALVLSSAALAALRLMGETSVRFRTTLALIGLLAWFMPWYQLTLPLSTQESFPFTQWIGTTSIAFDQDAGSACVPATGSPSAVPTGPWWLLLFLPGALLFPLDLVRRTRALNSLERQSHDGEYLRSLLPDSLQLIPARIRIIPGANAMATGMRRGTIWVGDDLGSLVPMVMDTSSDFRRVRALESGPKSRTRRFNAIAIVLAAGLLALSVNAQQRDPRIGEWREDPDSPNYAGLYMIYEDLGNGMTRVHTAENLSPQYRIHSVSRCDGDLYPSVYSTGIPTGTSARCTIVDATTLAIRWIRDVDGEWAEGEGTWTLSSDGNHFTTVVEVTDRDGNVIQTNERRFTRNAENCLNHAREDMFRECQQRTRPRRN